MNSKQPHWLVLAVLAFLIPVGCAEKTPEQRVMELRSHYTAEMNGFIAKAETPPLPEPMSDEAGEGSDTDTAGESSGDAADGATGIEEEDLAVGPLMSSILLDVIVMHDAQENLPGITIDVTQADPDQKEKAHFRFWVDTSSLARGQQAQVNHVLESIDYADGDGFYAEIRRPIPEAERGDYQEYQP